MYNKEEFKFLNMKKVHKRLKVEVFQIETELSIEEKLEFIDHVADGIGTYMFEILTKWEKEKDNLPKDIYGSPKTVSKKAWLKRNDPRTIIDNSYKIGSYYMFKDKIKCMDLTTPSTEWGNMDTYTGEHIIHQWYHSLCNKLYIEEKAYFKTIDTFEIKKSKVIEFGERYRTVFDNEDIGNIVWNNKSSGVTESQLDIFIAAYEELEKSIEVISTNMINKLKDM